MTKQADGPCLYVYIDLNEAKDGRSVRPAAKGREVEGELGTNKKVSLL